MNFVPGNSLQAIDLSVAKTTTFAERYRTELRGEFCAEQSGRVIGHGLAGGAGREQSGREAESKAGSHDRLLSSTTIAT